MGLLVDGKWVDQWYDTEKHEGKFIRQASLFRDSLGSPQFPIETDRYHLYVSYACPWAHRTLIFRQLKSLADLISVSAVHPHMLDNGWAFQEPFIDHVYQANYLRDLYVKANSSYSGRVTVPLLWDKKRGKAVNNESTEILRMFNVAFNEKTNNQLDFYPKELRDEIDDVNETVYHTVNNGVYQAGFASRQEAYDLAVTSLFSTLESLEKRLSKQQFLVGDTLTEADFRLLPTLLRFDAVYVTHFKCDRKRVVDYPNLFDYCKQLIQIPSLAETFHMDHIREHYFRSHPTINPYGILSVGPEVDFFEPHHREPNPMRFVRGWRAQ